MADTVIFAETLDEFAVLELYGLYGQFIMPPPFSLTAGESYKVAWDGKEYECVAQDTSAAIAGTVAVGNGAAFGYSGNNEPFIICTSATDVTFISLTDTEETPHPVAIYQETAEGDSSEESSTGATIVLYDRTGAPVTYEGVETLTTDTPVAGETTTFTHGVLMDGVEIPLDMSSGNQPISVPDGYLVKKATILKPDTLLPENVKRGVSIAGVVGEFAGDEAEKTVELDMADGDQVIEADEGTVLTKVTVLKPDTLVPENIAEGVEIGGVVGTSKLPQLYPITSALSVSTDVNGYKRIYIYKTSSNGNFAPAVQIVDTKTEEVLFEKDDGASFSTMYIYGHQFFKHPLEQPFKVSARLVKENFAPSEFKDGTDDFWLTDITYLLQNCVSDVTYPMLFSGDNIAMNISPADGYYLPKATQVISKDGNVTCEYDNFTGALSFVVPPAETVYVNAVAENTAWIHNPILAYDDVQRTISVAYIDKNAASTPVACNGEIVFLLEDQREGLVGYTITEKADGASYRFARQSDGYYKEETNGSQYSCALCRVDFDMATAGTVTISYVNYGYSIYDYGIVSKVDCTLSTSYSTDIDTSSSNVYTTFKGSNSTSAKTLSISVPAGKHFIYLKYRRYASASTSYYLKFKVTTEPAASTVYNLTDYIPDYGIYPLYIQSIADGYQPSDELFIEHAYGPTIEINNRSVLKITEIIDGVTSINLYVDGELIDTLPYDYSEDWNITLSNYAMDEESHDVYAEAVGEGISPNRSNVVNAFLIDVPIYGVTGMTGEATTMERTADAVEMNYAVGADGVGTSDFDSAFPWSEMREVADADGNVFVQFPEMYFKVETNDSMEITSVAVAKKPATKELWHKVEAFCYGKYTSGLSGDRFVIDGTKSSFTRADAGTYASNAGYALLDLYHHTVIKFLYWIETANKYATSTTAPQYRQICDFIHLLGEWITGASLYFYTAGGQYTFEVYKDGTYVTVPYTVPKSGGDGRYITSWGWSDDLPFCCLPATVKDSSTAVGFGGEWCGDWDNPTNVIVGDDSALASMKSAAYSTDKAYARLIYKGTIE